MKKGYKAFKKICYRAFCLSVFFLVILFFSISPVWAQTDITNFVTVNSDRLFYDYENLQTYIDISLTNSSDHTFQTPILLVIDSVIPSEITVVDPDGYMEDGKPYFNFSCFFCNKKFDPYETSTLRRVKFDNPQRLRFDYVPEVFDKAKKLKKYK